MSVARITDKVAVSSQPDVHAFRAIAQDGFTAIVNTRPDREDAGQPGNVAESTAARAVGLTYTFIPVKGPTITEADIRAFQKALAVAEGPVFAHCKSGTRALALYVLGEVLDERMKQAEVEDFGRRHGFDLSVASRWLARKAVKAPQVKGFYDPRSGSIQYVVTDPQTKHCAIIDPVYDFDEKSGATALTHADEILAYVARERLTVEWILDTHPHADHFSAAYYLKQKTGAPIAIGSHIVAVQRMRQELYNWPELKIDDAQWDRLFDDGDTFRVGALEGRVMFSRGHTPASVIYVIRDAAFISDTIFMPDSGTARADFPGGSAKELWASIQAILAMRNETRLFTGHDYQPGGRNVKWESTVGEQKRDNPHLVGMTEERFVALREALDSKLSMPRQILRARI